MKPKLSISFSGGRSSAVMTKLVMDECRGTHDIRVTFANTGCEDERTLQFVRDCDNAWQLGVVWLEAVVAHGERVGIRHKVVSFETASRNGEPFEEVVKKYGIPNKGLPQCTSRLKTEVMESYLQSQGFYRGSKLNYDTAIGIRADECDRMSVKAKEQRFTYPLIRMGYTKPMVLDFMQQFPFDLSLPEHFGNCVWCWKKSDRKLYTIALQKMDAFDVPRRLERQYGCIKANNGVRRFFRQDRSAEDIIDEAIISDFKKFDDPNYVQFDHQQFDESLDKQEGCQEICDVYSEYH